ncbi:MAG: hypothetical protein COS84_12000 [Armatimonadetes bacterium CG07_land_8_20_14_0_80_40_9]|nr:MAG: hypothetical protein COS84_12000 [Armatimonadetes bacterium CG07_land_8_20_14_0_80_40_9]
MSFGWQFYLNLAKILIDERKANIEEAYLRTSISRSYYGVFCIARNILKGKGLKIPRTDLHKYVITQYKKSTNPIEEKIGESLARLRKKRNKADYLDQPQICENEARSAYLEAQKVLYNLKRI